MANSREVVKTGDIQRIEINEAFAAIAVAVTRDLGLPEDIVNVEGGAIAMVIRSARAERCSRLVCCIRCNATGSNGGSSRCASEVGRASH